MGDVCQDIFHIFTACPADPARVLACVMSRSSTDRIRWSVAFCALAIRCCLPPEMDSHKLSRTNAHTIAKSLG